MHITIHERLIFGKLKEKENGKLEICVIVRVNIVAPAFANILQPDDTKDTVNKVNEIALLCADNP